MTDNYKKSEINPSDYAIDWELTPRDLEFITSKELKPVRLLLEYLRPNIILESKNITNGIVFFGSARILEPKQARKKLTEIELKIKECPEDQDLQKRHKTLKNSYKYSKYLQEATKLAEIVSKSEQNYTVFTGGGPGFMEAANKGAHKAGKPSVCLHVTLPFEEQITKYSTPELTFQFKYFSIRKIHFLKRAKALIAFPGGFGTLDELFEALTLHQNNKLDPMPIILFHKYYWKKIINFDYLIEIGTIDKSDIDCLYFVETAKEAWEIITEYYKE